MDYYIIEQVHRQLVKNLEPIGNWLRSWKSCTSHRYYIQANVTRFNDEDGDADYVFLDFIGLHEIRPSSG
jgi:hypothetical protein